MNEEQMEPTPSPEVPARRARRVTRRTAIKSGAAAAGIVLAGAYIAPDILTVPIVEAQTPISYPPGPTPTPPAGQASIQLAKTVTTSLADFQTTRSMSGYITITNSSSGNPAPWVYVDISSVGDRIEYKDGTTTGNDPKILASLSAGTLTLNWTRHLPEITYPDSGVQPGTSQNYGFKITIPESVDMSVLSGASWVRNVISLEVIWGHKVFEGNGSLTQSTLKKSAQTASQTVTVNVVAEEIKSATSPDLQ